jgi:hypothetical protein
MRIDKSKVVFLIPGNFCRVPQPQSPIEIHPYHIQYQDEAVMTCREKRLLASLATRWSVVDTVAREDSHVAELVHPFSVVIPREDGSMAEDAVLPSCSTRALLMIVESRCFVDGRSLGQTPGARYDTPGRLDVKLLTT